MFGPTALLTRCRRSGKPASGVEWKPWLRGCWFAMIGLAQRRHVQSKVQNGNKPTGPNSSIAEEANGFFQPSFRDRPTSAAT
jgi:hypothetical protein